MTWHALNLTFASVHGDQPLPAFAAFILTASLVPLAVLLGPRTKVVRMFALNSFFISCWAFGIYELTVALNGTQGLFWVRWLNAMAAFIPSTFFHFAALLTDTDKDRITRRVLVVGYAMSCLLMVLSPTSLFIRGTIPMPGFYYYPAPGLLFFPYMVFHVGYVLWALARLFKSATSSTGPKSNTISYVLLAYLFGYGGGSQTFLVGLHLPMWKYAMDMVPIAFSFILYAIVARQLLDIRIVVRRTLLYSLCTAIMAAAYAGLVTLLAYLVGSGDRLPSLIFSAHAPARLSWRWMAAALQGNFGYACLVTAFLSAVFGAYVLVKNVKGPVNRLWFLLSISISGWSLGLGFLVNASTFATAFHWQVCLYAFAIVIPILFLHFISQILEIHIGRALAVGYAFAVIFEVLNFQGRLATAAPHPPFQFYTSALPAYRWYVAYHIVLSLISNVILFAQFKRSRGAFREQLKYIFFGAFLGFGGGLMTFFYTYNVPIFPYGVYLVPVYIVTVSYAIFRHQLMGITVVIRKTLLYSLVSAVLAAVYVGTVTLLAYILQGRHASASPYSPALAAVFITLLFNPIRRRAQLLMDRYFFREAMDQAMLREATSGFVHEIKRPLANISLPAELSLMDAREMLDGRKTMHEVLPKVIERLEYILHQTNEAGDKIEAIRAVASTDPGQAKELDLCMVIRRGATAEKTLCHRHEVIVHLDLEDEPLTVRGHAKQLEIVTTNLLKNAVEAIADRKLPGEKSIYVSGRRKGDHIVVSVRDTGPGIDPENLEHLFEPYFTTKGVQGTGMGLFLCRQIIQAHGGEIFAEPGKRERDGAEIIILLPKVGGIYPTT